MKSRKIGPFRSEPQPWVRLGKGWTQPSWAGIERLIPRELLAHSELQLAIDFNGVTDGNARLPAVHLAVSRQGIGP